MSIAKHKQTQRESENKLVVTSGEEDVGKSNIGAWD